MWALGMGLAQRMHFPTVFVVIKFFVPANHILFW